MHLVLNWITVLLALIISQSLLASGLLFFARDNRRSNRILALLIFLLVLWLCDDLMRIGRIYRQQPNLYFLPIFYSFAFAPLIWFYVQSLTQEIFRFRWLHLLHFLPVMCQALLYWSLTFTSYQTKAWYWEHIHQPYTYRLEFDGTWLSLLIYGYLSLRLVRHYQMWVSNNFSAVANIRLNWLMIILAALLLLCLQWLAEIVMRDGFNYYFNYDFTVQFLGVLLLILAIGGLRQSSLKGIQYVEPVAEKEVFTPEPAILQKITAAMESDQLYLNPALTLTELAAHLKINSRLVSRHINSCFELSFNDYVNSYRVEAVKARIDAGDLQKFTLLAIATDCGFNSKTSFNRTFKEMTGMPPSDYKS
ncbi:helix-turn-helix domain-containing protein [Mucilaginibacter sp. HD30]